jgi:hypothetical protein
MLRWASNYFASIPTMFIDGLLYTALAILTGINTTFGGDEAAKYVSPEPLFWVKSLCSWSAQGLLAVKLYRSTAFADHQDAKKQAVPTFTPETGKEIPTP